MEETVSRIQRRSTSRGDLQETYNRLNLFIEKLNDKIINRIQLVQQTYLEDYKAQVKQMAEGLKSIRAVLDEELLKQRSNERLFYLQQQRDFFRGQTMKLNEQVTALTKANTKIKAELDQVKAESANYKHIVYGLQKKIAKVHQDAFQLQKLNNPSMRTFSLKQKAQLSLSPTKTTLTRYSPDLACPEIRAIHKSVEFKRSPIKQSMDSELKRREQILEQCIKDIKKKIFYRTTQQKSATKQFFNEQKEIPFDKFTRTDKQQLIRSILNRDDLLSQFYLFMIGKKQGNKLDSKKTIINKSAFSDKIFKIKFCGMNDLL